MLEAFMLLSQLCLLANSHFYCQKLCAGQTIRVGINSTHLTAKRAATSGRAQVVSGHPDCEAADSLMPSSGMPPSLMSFCGSYDITLREAVVSELWLAEDTQYALLVFGGNVTASIMGGTFTHNRGSSLMVLGAATARVVDTVISNNMAFAGAGMVARGNASLILANSSLSNNSTAAAADPSGRAGSGGAILADEFAVLAVNDSIIYNCSATSVGGGMAAFVAASMSLGNVTISQCSASFGGGAIATDTASIFSYRSTWSANTCQQEGGGLLLRGNASVVAYESKFESNTANVSGGAASVGCSCSQDGVASGEFSSCTFNSNMGGVGDFNMYGTVGAGGGLAGRCGASIQVQDCTFQNNTSDADGAAVWVSDSVTLNVTASGFTMNHAGSTGGGVTAMESCTVDITSSTFRANLADNEGGGVEMFDSTVHITNCTFAENNSLFAGAVGGRGNQTMLIENTVMRDNYASLDCGALVLNDNNQVTLFFVEVTGNTAARTVGGLCVQMKSSLLMTNETRVSNNTGTTMCGALFVTDAASVTFEHGMLSYNGVHDKKEGAVGGALLVRLNATASLYNVSLSGNVAYDGAAAAVLDNGQFVVNSSEVSANAASRGGGAIYAANNGRVNITATRLVNNSAAGSGAAVSATDTSVVTVQDCILEQGMAGVAGGCAYGSVHAAVTLVGSVCQSNSAGQNGGGFYMHDFGQLLLLGNSTVVGNVAQQNGGGIYVADASLLTLSAASLVSENAALGGQGGGLAAVSSGFDPDQVQLAVLHNSAKHSSNIFPNATGLAIVGSTYIRGFVSLLGGAGSFLPVKVNVTGHYGLPASGVLIQALLVYDGTAIFMGANTSDSSGLVEFDVRLRQPPGNYSLKFSLIDDLNDPSAAMGVEVRPCIAGEIQSSPDTCQVRP